MSEGIEEKPVMVISVPRPDGSRAEVPIYQSQVDATTRQGLEIVEHPRCEGCGEDDHVVLANLYNALLQWEQGRRVAALNGTLRSYPLPPVTVRSLGCRATNWCANCRERANALVAPRTPITA